MQSLIRVALIDLIKVPNIVKRPNLVTSRCLPRVSAYSPYLLRTQARKFVEDRKQDQTLKTTPNVAHISLQSNKNTIQGDLDSDLPSEEAGRRFAVTKNFSNLMDRLQGNIFTASQRINDITGYSGIEVLKNRIADLESRLQDAQNAVRAARLTYKTTVSDRASSQREVTTLLARKDSWSPGDLERFTTLYRMDHSNEQAVQEAATRLADAEREVENASSQLRNSILSRYHEEQIWSDKIRRMSTWGTWGLMGVNVLLFFIFQFGFEPWRRKKLIQGFEGKVLEALEIEKSLRTFDDKDHSFVSSPNVDIDTDTDTDTVEVDPKVVNQSDLADLDTMIEESRISLKDPEDVIAVDATNMSLLERIANVTRSENIAIYVADVKDLFSDRIIEVRKQDIMIIALESAMIGASIATTVFFIFSNNSLL